MFWRSSDLCYRTSSKFGGATIFEYGLFQESDGQMEQIELIIETHLDDTSSIHLHLSSIIKSSYHLNLIRKNKILM